jgi:hypothetical protein
VRAAQEEYDKCVSVAAAQKDKAAAFEKALADVRAREQTLLDFRALIFQLLETYSAWGKMREPIALAVMRLAATNPDVKDLIEPEDPADHRRAGNAEGRGVQIGKEYTTLERQLNSLKKELAKIAAALLEHAENVDDLLEKLDRANLADAKRWLGMLPMADLRREVEVPVTGGGEDGSDKVGLRKACDQVLDDLAKNISIYRADITHKEIGAARSIAMVGTIEAVTAAIERRRATAIADLELQKKEFRATIQEVDQVVQKDAAALDLELPAKKRQDEANKEWSDLSGDINAEVAIMEKNIKEGPAGALHMKEILLMRWNELKAASTEYIATREAFWENIYKVTGHLGAKPLTLNQTYSRSSSLSRSPFSKVEGHSVRDLAKEGDAATIIQAGFRTFLARKKWKEMNEGATIIQTRWRAKRNEKMQLKEAVVTIEASFLKHMDRRRRLEKIRNTPMEEAEPPLRSVPVKDTRSDVDWESIPLPSASRLSPDIRNKLKLDLSPVLDQHEKSQRGKPVYKVSPGPAKIQLNYNPAEEERKKKLIAAAYGGSRREGNTPTKSSTPKRDPAKVSTPKRLGTAGPPLQVSGDMIALREVIQRCTAGATVMLTELSGTAASKTGEVNLMLTRDFSRVAYKTAASKTSSFIRVADIMSVVTGRSGQKVKSTIAKARNAPMGRGLFSVVSQTMDRAEQTSLTVKAKGAKEYVVVFEHDEEQKAWLQSLQAILANKSMLTSFKSMLGL